MGRGDIMNKDIFKNAIRHTRVVGLIVVSAVALGACKPAAKAGGDAQPAGAKNADAGSCSSYTAGKDGVIRTFCDGPGVLHVELDGVARTLNGGSCEALGDMMSFNVGVVTGNGSAVKSDYFGLTTEKAGPFQNAVAGVAFNGKGYLFMRNSGILTAHSGSFEGTGYAVGAESVPVHIKADFTC